ncbi:uncharacterized protein LOC123717962 [Pieris brassicae]|nr:uncharacterized protein LOC123717962 [Pieris brassicae]
MSDYAKLKKLDEESLQQLKEGSGPADECLCSIFSPGIEKKSFTKSVKRALGLSGRKKQVFTGNESVDIPLTFSRDGKGVYTTKEVVKRQTPCGKCGCDNENIVLKHSYANIRITTPDISSICPCPTTDCLPDKERLQNNIKVIVERAGVSTQSMQDIKNNGEDITKTI